MTRTLLKLLAVALLSFQCGLFTGRGTNQVAAEQPPAIRLHQIQIIGTHNSYHLAPDSTARRLIQTFAPREAEANDYSHRPIPEQLERLGVRQIELDLYWDPEGGLYAQPLALRLAAQSQTSLPPFDPAQELKQPGIKILHSPDVDFRSTVATFKQALTEIKKWSSSRPNHLPVFLLLELKSDSFSPFVKPLSWNEAAMAGLKEEILQIFDRDQIVTPDDVRGEYETLREAVLERGWPALATCRGKVVFLLDNEDSVRSRYLAMEPQLRNELLFASVDRNHPAAAWMKRNDPIGSAAEIRELVEAGFLVRTRADAGTWAARLHDVRQRDAALASGAQLISTDFPEPDVRFSSYCVGWPNHMVARPNPVSGRLISDEAVLEELSRSDALPTAAPLLPVSSGCRTRRFGRILRR